MKQCLAAIAVVPNIFLFRGYHNKAIHVREGIFFMLGKASYSLECRGHTWAGRHEPKGKRVRELEKRR